MRGERGDRGGEGILEISAKLMFPYCIEPIIVGEALTSTRSRWYHKDVTYRNVRGRFRKRGKKRGSDIKYCNSLNCSVDPR